MLFPTTFISALEKIGVGLKKWGINPYGDKKANCQVFDYKAWYYPLWEH